MIVLFRIDERLIHGQVAVAWSKTLKVTHIVVASDKAAESELQKAALKMAAPADVKVTVRSMESAAEVLNDPRLADKRVMVVVKTPRDALNLARLVPGIPMVNLGNCGFLEGDGKKNYSSYIRLDDGDIQVLRELQILAPVEIQILPTEQKKTLDNFLKGE